MTALKDLVNLVKHLSETISVIVAKLDDPALTKFWDDGWERVMSEETP